MNVQVLVLRIDRGKEHTTAECVVDEGSSSDGYVDCACLNAVKIIINCGLQETAVFFEEFRVARPGCGSPSRLLW
jgi:hypothetical protein